MSKETIMFLTSRLFIYEYNSQTSNNWLLDSLLQDFTFNHNKHILLTLIQWPMCYI